MKLRFRITIGLLFLAAGLLLGSVPYLSGRMSKQALSGTAVMGSATKVPIESGAITSPVSGKPVRIVIPSAKIDVTVVDGFYDAKDQSWTLNEDKAQFATLTKPSNNTEGNTFIYGHNNKNVFASLPSIKLGAEAIVYTDNHHKFTYQYTSLYTTKPQDSSLFTYQGPPKLTLQTCTGIWYQNRSLYSFQLKDVR